MEFQSFAKTIRDASLSFGKRRDSLLLEYKASILEKEKRLDELEVNAAAIAKLYDQLTEDKAEGAII
jgi:hypothetical protein